jgi:hypothetical protein
MSFDWREFLLITHELRNDPRESIQRTCLGRSYYYVYNLGLSKARNLSCVPNNDSGVHHQLWSWCESHPDQTIKQIRIDARRMQAMRIAADHKDERIINLTREVKRQLSRAQAIEISIAKSDNQTPPAPLS